MKNPQYKHSKPIHLEPKKKLSSGQKPTVSNWQPYISQAQREEMEILERQKNPQPLPPLELRVITGVGAISRKGERYDCSVIVINDDPNRREVTCYDDPNSLHHSFDVQLGKTTTAGLVGNGESKRLRVGKTYYTLEPKAGKSVEQIQETPMTFKNRYDNLWTYLHHYPPKK